MRENELTGFSRGVALVDDVSVLVQLDVGLANNVFVLFPRRQIERIRFETRFAVRADTLVCFLNIFLRHVIIRLELCVAAVSHARMNSPAFRAALRSLTMYPFSSSSMLAWPTTCLSSSHAVR